MKLHSLSSEAPGAALVEDVGVVLECQTETSWESRRGEDISVLRGIM